MLIRYINQLTVIDENLYVVVLALLKFGVMSLHRQIFGSSRRFVICTWMATALVAEWMLQVILASNLQCIPISAVWDLNIQGKCIEYGSEALAAYIINITVDLVILSIPIPLVLKLKMSQSKKLGLIIAVTIIGTSPIWGPHTGYRGWGS